MEDSFSNIVQRAFKRRVYFTKDELEKVLVKYYPDNNGNTLTWRIHDLKNRGIIQNIARGIYSLANKKEFSPDISDEAVGLYKQIHRDFPYITICITDTRWFNEFMLHQVFKTYLIIEVEKSAASTVFNKLTDEGEKVFLNPDSNIIERYISNTEGALIVKSLISESPVEEQAGIKIASLEKMLVDCVADAKIYSAQAQEINLIFKNATEKYSINSSTLKRYARRRNKIDAVTKLMQAYLNDSQSNL
jgi:predicted transcriptional regulator of viral defense system